jgi:hypothetical protein
VNGNGVQLTAGSDSQAVVTVGGHTLTAVDVGKSIMLKDGSSTVLVKEGSQTKFEGQTVSVGPNGSVVVINGKTATLSAVGGGSTTESAIITAGGHTITALDKPGSVILKDGSSTATVKDGKTITFEGQKITILPNGNAVVVNGKTTSFSSTSSATTGVGGYVNGGLGGTQSNTKSASGPVQTNAASSAYAGNTSTLLSGALFGFMSVLAFL